MSAAVLVVSGRKVEGSFLPLTQEWESFPSFNGRVIREKWTALFRTDDGDIGPLLGLTAVVRWGTEDPIGVKSHDCVITGATRTDGYSPFDLVLAGESDSTTPYATKESA